MAIKSEQDFIRWLRGRLPGEREFIDGEISEAGLYLRRMSIPGKMKYRSRQRTQFSKAGKVVLANTSL